MVACIMRDCALSGKIKHLLASLNTTINRTFCLCSSVSNESIAQGSSAHKWVFKLHKLCVVGIVKFACEASVWWMCVSVEATLAPNYWLLVCCGGSSHTLKWKLITKYVNIVILVIELPDLQWHCQQERATRFVVAVPSSWRLTGCLISR